MGGVFGSDWIMVYDTGSWVCDIRFIYHWFSIDLSVDDDLLKKKDPPGCGYHRFAA